MQADIPVVTIDGPSGSGKGTVCAKIAKKLGWNLLDSGALYRLVALDAEQSGVSFDETEQLVEITLNLDVNFTVVDDDEVRVWLHNDDVTDKIRTEISGNNASKVAVVPAVRSALLDRQRRFLTHPGLIADGRDMGTVVFPQAETKIFLTASAEERAQRRYNQLKEKGLNVSLAQLSKDIMERDKRDASRAVAPLKPADDAHILDTTGLSIPQVITRVLDTIQV